MQISDFNKGIDQLIQSQHFTESQLRKIQNAITRKIPLPFTNDMVQAIMADILGNNNLKKQTRRMRGLKEINANPEQWEYQGCQIDVTKNPFSIGVYAVFVNTRTGQRKTVKFPYGNPGCEIWVRETHTYHNGEYIYRATHLNPEGHKWKPPMFMPREASRILLQLQELNVQRIQDITEADAKAEGVKQYKSSGSKGIVTAYQNYLPKHGSPVMISAKASFETLLQSIIGYEMMIKNPWIWVLKFERTQPELKV